MVQSKLKETQTHAQLELIPGLLVYAFMRDVLKYFVNGPGISVENRTLGPALIPGLLAVDRLLSPGAPVNNCRWASIQWTWDQ